VYHFASTVNLIPIDRKAFNVSKKAILGRWTDGTVVVNFKPDAKLEWSCSTNEPNPFNSGARTHGYHPDWWSFVSWQLSLINNEHKAGLRIGVLRVDERELHVWEENHPNKMAHVFFRDT
jgi:hypothetical protein